MTPITILEHDGIKQPIKEWALDYGITPAIIIARLERGLSVADAITTPMRTGYRGQTLASSDMEAFIQSITSRPKQSAKRPMRKTLKISFQGVTLTLSEWAERTGLSSAAIYSRLRAGWEVERALTTPFYQRNAPNGRTALARAAGIDPRTVESRMRRGWSLELALSEKPGARMGRRPNSGPGVVADLAPSQGTGAGGTAQETPNIDFSGTQNVSDQP